jgi:hypothetical protein
MKTHYYDLFTRVLIYKEDNQFVAHALDFDLLGCGETEDAAKQELQHLVANQLTFAHEREKTEMVNFPAPKEFFERWEEAGRAQLKGELTSERPCELSTKAMVIAFTLGELRKLRNQSKAMFSKTEKLAFA